MPNRITFSQRAAFEAGLTTIYKDEVKRRPKEYKSWLREAPAEKWFEDSHDWSGLGIMPEKGIGAAIETDTIFEGSRKTHALKAYALALVIVHEVLKWDLYGIFPRLMKQLAKSATDRYNLVAFAILNNGFSTADSTYTDLRGEALFSDTHTRLDGGAWDNALTTGMSYLGLQQADLLVSQQVDERGRYIQLNPMQLIVSRQKKWLTQTLLKTGAAMGTANVDKNILPQYQITSSVYLTDEDAWFMWDKDEVDISLRLGESPSMSYDNVPSTMDRFGSSYCSFGVRVDKARGAIGSTGGS